MNRNTNDLNLEEIFREIIPSMRQLPLKQIRDNMERDQWERIQNPNRGVITERVLEFTDNKFAFKEKVSLNEKTL